jgi:hypothetical protein
MVVVTASGYNVTAIDYNTVNGYIAARGCKGDKFAHSLEINYINTIPYE